MAVVQAGDVVRLDKCPHFTRVRVVALGSLDTEEDDVKLLGVTVVTWTSMEDSDDIFAEEEVRGVVTPEGELAWLTGNSQVEVIDLPRYAGQPEELIKQATSVPTPPGAKGKSFGGMSMVTADGWHPLVWNQTTLHSAIQGWSDAQTSVEFILVALTYAPEEVRPTLLAGLRARYARVKRQPELYPPTSNPWIRNSVGPDLSMLRWQP
jgi:hypothetical protein